MKKKFAFVLMGTDFVPAEHHAQFETDACVFQMLTVRNPEEAKAKAVELAAEGVGVIEVCGAFGPDLARELIAATKGEMGVGYIVHHPEQNELFTRFFG